MGLFDVFGAGGGTAAIQIGATMVGAGSALQGNVVFTGGKRAQQITAVTMRVSQSHQSMKMTKEGPRQHTESRDVIPSFQISGATQSVPGQPQMFPFSINIPAAAPPSIQGQLSYTLHANIDIPGEVDAGASVPLTIVGGQMPMQQPMMGQMPQQPMGYPQQPMMGQMPQQPMGYPQQPMMGQMPQQPMMGQMPQQPMGYGQMPPQMPPPMAMPLQMGSFVVALHPSGNWAPGRVTAMQNGMIGVDWEDPKLGASSWVGADQVRVK